MRGDRFKIGERVIPRYGRHQDQVGIVRRIEPDPIALGEFTYFVKFVSRRIEEYTARELKRPPADSITDAARNWYYELQIKKNRAG